MLIREYSSFAERTDWKKELPMAERKRIAQYGIAAEIGSLVSAVKKKLLAPSRSAWNEANDEIVEELGDVLWYVAMFTRLEGQSLAEIARSDLAALSLEIDKDRTFKAALDQDKYRQFLRESPEYVDDSEGRAFTEYQELAFLTSRTQGQDLLHVCLTRLLFYSTVLLSKGFPQVEKLMQKDILDLPLQRALGMILWHVSAAARVFDKTLDEVAQFNIDKLRELYNTDCEDPTPLHDDGSEVPSSQKFPREFEVSFVTVGPGRLQMYHDGARLGDELTDNSSEDDGYRFHDIMHLANAAKLGWSPVLRSLMRRKRKFSPSIDEAQDGARAQIVEEAVVKAVHSEGERIGGGEAYCDAHRRVTLFTSKEQIPFSFLKLIKNLVKGLEVSKNRLWEWQEAIVEGHRIYAALHQEGQGTVRIDLNARTISFAPQVSPALKGAVVGTGIGKADLDGNAGDRLSAFKREALEDDPDRVARLVAQKDAILRSLGLSPEDEGTRNEIAVSDLPSGEVSVKTFGRVQEAAWRKGAICFQTVDVVFEGGVLCYAIALGDIPRAKD